MIHLPTIESPVAIGVEQIPFGQKMLQAAHLRRTHRPIGRAAHGAIARQWRRPEAVGFIADGRRGSGIDLSIVRDDGLAAQRHAGVVIGQLPEAARNAHSHGVGGIQAEEPGARITTTQMDVGAHIGFVKIGERRARRAPIPGGSPAW